MDIIRISKNTEWKTSRKKIYGKTTNEMQRHQEELLVAVEYSRMKGLTEDRDICKHRGQGLMVQTEVPLKKQMKKKKNLHVDAYVKAVSYRIISNEDWRTV